MSSQTYSPCITQVSRLPLSFIELAIPQLSTGEERRERYPITKGNLIMIDQHSQAFINDSVLDDLLRRTCQHEESGSPLEIKISQAFGEEYISHGAYEIVLNYQRSARILKELYPSQKSCAWARTQGIPDNEAIVKELRPIIDLIVEHYPPTRS